MVSRAAKVVYQSYIPVYIGYIIQVLHTQRRSSFVKSASRIPCAQLPDIFFVIFSEF